MAYQDVNYFELYSRSFEDELMHYGIIGQKWGDRNGPPYPLAKRVSNAVTAARNYTDAKREEHIEKAKSKAIASGDSKRILKNIDKMSTDEVRSALERIELRKKISDLDAVAALSGKEQQMKAKELAAKDAKLKRDSDFAAKEAKVKDRELKAREVKAKQTTSFISRFANTTATVFGALSPVTATIANILGIAKDAATLGKTTAEAVQQASKASAEAQKNAYTEETNALNIEAKRADNDRTKTEDSVREALLRNNGIEWYYENVMASSNGSGKISGEKVLNAITNLSNDDLTKLVTKLDSARDSNIRDSSGE